jgi:hypothetical protein
MEPQLREVPDVAPSPHASSTEEPVFVPVEPFEEERENPDCEQENSNEEIAPPVGLTDPRRLRQDIEQE